MTYDACDAFRRYFDGECDRDPVTQYAWDVLHTKYGKLCGELEKLACKRHLADMRLSAKKSFPYTFDPTRAERIVKHFGNIPRLDADNEMIRLERWQVFDYGSIFGWVRKEDGRRRFRYAFIENPRGHAKTTIAAGIGLYVLAGDAVYPPGKPELAAYEMQPEIDIVAVDRFQGRKAREDIADMGRTAPAISRLLIIKRSYIRHRTRGGEVVVFSKDKKNKDGGRPSLVIAEEWHAHDDRVIHEAARKGMGKKKQCLDLMITTAGDDAENKPCYQDHLQYERVLRGEFRQDDTFIMIRCIDTSDDVHDKKCWAKANAFFREPGDYGKTLLETVTSEYEDAYNANNYAKIREWLIKRMDRWQTDGENKYMSGLMERFKALEVSPDEFRELTRGVPGYYGFDLGDVRDLTGVGWCAELPDGRIAVSVTGFMAQNRAMEHMKSDRVPYMEWAAAGFVNLTPGGVTDNVYVEDYIYTCETENEEIPHATGRAAIEVCYDGHNANDMALRMRTHYNSEEKLVDVHQNCATLNLATKRFRELVISGGMVAEYSPLLEWCLSNAVEVRDSNGNIKLSKRYKNDTQRIDPVAGLMNALTRLLIHTEGKKVDANEIVARRGFVL